MTKQIVSFRIFSKALKGSSSQIFPRIRKFIIILTIIIIIIIFVIAVWEGSDVTDT